MTADIAILFQEKVQSQGKKVNEKVSLTRFESKVGQESKKSLQDVHNIGNSSFKQLIHM